MTSIFITSPSRPLRRAIRGSLLLLLVVVCAPTQAQGDKTSKGTYLFEDAQWVWRNTSNAAGLGLDSLTSRGLTFFELSQLNTDHYLVQNGKKQNTIHFLSER